MSDKENNSGQGGPQAEDFLLTLIETLKSNTVALTALDYDLKELRNNIDKGVTDSEFKEKVTDLENKIVSEISVIRHAIDEVHDDLNKRNIIEEVKVNEEKEWREKIYSALTSKPALLTYSFLVYVLIGQIFPMIGIDFSVLWDFVKAVVF